MRCQWLFTDIELQTINAYPANLFCKRYFEAPVNYLHSFTVMQLNMNSTNCTKDKVVVYDYSSKQSFNICSIDFKYSWGHTIVTSNKMLLTFTTNGDKVARSLKASVHEVEIAKNLTELSCYPNMTADFHNCFSVENVENCFEASCFFGAGDINVFTFTTFEKAVKKCNEVGHLPIIENKEKQILIDTINLENQFFNLTTFVWIGAKYDVFSNSYYWINDNKTIDLTYWHFYNITNFNLTEKQCVKLSTTSGLWHPEECNALWPYFCEIDKNKYFRYLIDSTQKVYKELRITRENLKEIQTSHLDEIKFEVSQINASLINVQTDLSKQVLLNSKLLDKVTEMQKEAENEINDKVQRIERSINASISSITELTKDNSEKNTDQISQLETELKQTLLREFLNLGLINENISSQQNELLVKRFETSQSVTEIERNLVNHSAKIEAFHSYLNSTFTTLSDENENIRKIFESNFSLFTKLLLEKFIDFGNQTEQLDLKLDLTSDAIELYLLALNESLTTQQINITTQNNKQFQELYLFLNATFNDAKSFEVNNFKALSDDQTVLNQKLDSNNLLLSEISPNVNLKLEFISDRIHQFEISTGNEITNLYNLLNDSKVTKSQLEELKGFLNQTEVSNDNNLIRNSLTELKNDLNGKLSKHLIEFAELKEAFNSTINALFNKLANLEMSTQEISQVKNLLNNRSLQINLNIIDLLCLIVLLQIVSIFAICCFCIRFKRNKTQNYPEPKEDTSQIKLHEINKFYEEID